MSWLLRYRITAAGCELACKLVKADEMLNGCLPVITESASSLPQLSRNIEPKQRANDGYISIVLRRPKH